ncbi:MAG TPA: GspE/PulE family protein [Candidatus Baltobacteraceae bacterium]|nr:GspE/PulE family protein [Candidatus Baltobacteraceae bacterium]
MIATRDEIREEIDVVRIEVERAALERVPRSLALRYDILAVFTEGNEITVALPDANDRDAIERVRLATAMHVKALPAPRDAIRARLLREYDDARSGGMTLVQRSDDAPAVSLLDEILGLAVGSGASDVHFEPLHGCGRIRQRVDGVLRQIREIPSDLFTQLTSRIKLLAEMDIADRRQPQDGRYTLAVRGRSVEARVCSVPTIHGEKVAVRLLDKHASQPQLDQLGMSPTTLEHVRSSIHLPHGMVLICGPTGSGKTTTLYAALAERNAECQNVCSIEDPVELRIPGMTQVQVNVKAGVTFSSALRAFLRQDPNVIMVGELRDDETAAVACAASICGQLVMTSIHANDTLTAIGRLIELGAARHTVSAGLTAVIAQRLVRRLCARCRIAHSPGPATRAEFGLGEGICVFRAQGCAACAGEGYLGRTAIFEALTVSEGLRSLISAGAPLGLCDRAPLDAMRADGLNKVLAGDTTLDEVLRVVPPRRDAA